MSCFQSRFKSSTWFEEIELEAEVRNARNERDTQTQEPVDDSVVRHAPQTRRGLKSRHVQLIALGEVSVLDSLSDQAQRSLWQDQLPCLCVSLLDATRSPTY